MTNTVDLNEEVTSSVVSVMYRFSTKYSKYYDYIILTLIKAMVSGSLLAGVLLLGSLAVGWICYDRAMPYSLWEQTLYEGSHRTAWAAALAWFIVAEATTGFGVFYRTMRHRFFTPFGRLTYCVSLVHTISQIYLTASARVPDNFSVPKLFWVVTADGAAAYILALWLNLLFEAPLERLHKNTIRRFLGGSKTPKPNDLGLSNRVGQSQDLFTRVRKQETNKTNTGNLPSLATENLEIVYQIYRLPL